MALKNKDFIEVEFTGKTKEGEIFDSNIKEDLKELNKEHSHEIETKPFILCLGEGMFLKSIDEFLIGKEDSHFPAGYDVELPPEKAFGFRNSRLVQMVPLKVFLQNETKPVPGMMFNMDGRIAKILSVSGGRVVIDFNNPLAGKSVSYKIRVLRKVEDLNEKLKSFIEFIFRRDLKFEIRDKKLIIHAEKPLVEFVKLFSDKFRDLFELELEVKELEEIKEHIHEHGEHVHEHNH